MKLTWKKWACFLVVSVAVGGICQLYAQKRLISWGDLEMLAPVLDAEYTEGRNWYAEFTDAAGKYSYLPWPMTTLRRAREFDPDNPQTTDPETILGLALVAQQHVFRREMRERSVRLTDLALSFCKDEQTRQTLRRVSLAVEISEGPMVYAQYGFPRPSGSAAASRPSSTQPATLRAQTSLTEAQALEFIYQQANEIDPTNALYVYDRAMRLAVEIAPPDTELGPWEVGRIRDSLVADKEALLTAANRLDDILTHAERDCKVNCYWALRRKLVGKGMLFSLGNALPEEFVALQSIQILLSPFVQPCRNLARRSCLLGDVLADDEQDVLALKMYRHAYQLGEQLMFAEGPDAPVIQVLGGAACRGMAVEHLMKFWAKRGNAEKVVQLSSFLEDMTRRRTAAASAWSRHGMDVLGHNESAWMSLMRAAGLTWWFGITAAAIMALSVLASGLYLATFRTRHVGQSDLRISWRMLLAGVILPVGLMFWLAAMVPVRLDSYQRLGGALLWGDVLVTAWVIGIGLLVRRAVGQTDETRRPPTGWIWPAVLLAAFAAGVCVTVWEGSEALGPAAVTTAAAMAAGIVIWWIVSFVGYLRRFKPVDLAYRARANKGFAVCAMLAAMVALLGALATMSLTRQRQKTYYNLTVAEMRNETRIFFGDDWPESYRGLAEDVFELDQPTSAPASRTGKSTNSNE